MCNLYSITKGQAAIIAFTRAMRDKAGNLPPLPGIFPDYTAPAVRNAPDGVRELAMLRWGMPGPAIFGGAPITNIRNPLQFILGGRRGVSQGLELKDDKVQTTFRAHFEGAGNGLPAARSESFSSDTKALAR